MKFIHNNIDRHIHTNLSDGSLSPIEIIDLATKNKINIISITDHDTCDAYTNHLYEYAKNKNYNTSTYLGQPIVKFNHLFIKIDRKI